MLKDADVTLAVLAGGEGERMGRPKGQLQIGGRPILEYLLHRFAWRGPTLLVTAPGREHPPGWQQFDGELIDPVSGQGPLRGVLTALENLTTPMLAVTTVDMPGVGPDQLRWLGAELLRRSHALGCMLRRTTPDGEQVEPFPLICRGAARAPVEAQIQFHRRAVHALLDREGFLALEAPPDWLAEVWTNLNRPEDLIAFRADGW